MSVAKSHIPSRAPPAGSVASGRSHRTGITVRAPGDGPDTERRRSIASTRAPTVVPADSISQAGDSDREPSRIARSSYAGGSRAGSQRLTAEALEALSERNSNAGRGTVLTHRVEVVEEEASRQLPSRSRAASQPPRSSYPAAQSAKTDTVRSSHSVSKPAGEPSKAASKAPSHRSSRHTTVNVVEVTEPADPNPVKVKSVAPSHHSTKTASKVQPAVEARSVAPSQARSRVVSHAASKAPTAAASHHSEAAPTKSVTSHAPSHHSTAKPAKSVASRAASHHSTARSGASHATSHRSSHHPSHHEQHSTAPTLPTSPTAPAPPPAFEERTGGSFSGTRVEEDMQIVKRGSYDVVAPRDTTVDIVERRHRDGKLLERDYTILPPRAWQPAMSVGVADGSVYRKQYRYRRPKRVAYMRRLSSYDGY